MIDSLEKLTSLLRKEGATRIYAKRLAPDDNSKNQIYLGSDFTALNVIPHGMVEVDSGSKGGSKRDRAKAGICFCWVGESGRHSAPGAQRSPGQALLPKHGQSRM